MILLFLLFFHNVAAPFTSVAQIPCTETIEKITQNIGYSKMLIQECVSHCKNLNNFDALYAVHEELDSILNRLDVCNK